MIKLVSDSNTMPDSERFSDILTSLGRAGRYNGNVAEVGDGETALQRTNELLDVVVMDVAMPDMSGTETMRHLLAEHPRIRVLALSTYIDQRIVQQMLELGARTYIVKSAVAA